MLAKEKLDAVVIAVPSAFHKKVALDCIEFGVDILIEKPIACNLEDAQEIINRAKEKNIIEVTLWVQLRLVYFHLI